MSQYYPPDRLVNRKFETATKEQDQSRTQSVGTQIANRKFLHRPLTRKEYEFVVNAFHALGFMRGWLQEYESHRTYRPDFSRDHPFE